eukprot:363564-Chlamydomonas_euryale.AAC.16
MGIMSSTVTPRQHTSSRTYRNTEAAYLFKNGNNVPNLLDFVVCDEHTAIVELAHETLRMCHKLGTAVTTVNLHAFLHIHGRLCGAAALDRQHSVGANLQVWIRTHAASSF